MDTCTYKMNILVDLGCSIYEVVISSEPNKTHLTLSSYPKMSNVIEMKGLGTNLPHSDEYHPSLHSALAEYRRSFISISDLFWSGKYIVAPTFETSVQ